MTNKRTLDDKISQGNIIEQTGAYQPRIPRGKTENKAYLKIQLHAAKDLYAHRLGIARSIIATSDEWDPQRVLVNALTRNGLSPEVYEGWDQYMLLLAERYGGWGRFIAELEKNAYIPRAEKIQSWRSASIFAGIVLIPVIVLIVTSVLSLPSTLSLALTILAGVGSVLGAWKMYPRLSLITSASTRYGRPKRDVNTFVSYHDSPLFARR